MKTKTIGEMLREARTFHRLSVEDFSKRTRIRSEYVTALENNQFDLLPAATFVKGYIKTYGTIFGFDYQPLIGLLRRDYKESARGKLVPREFLKPVLKKSQLSAPVTVAVLILVTLFASLISYVGFQWYNLNKPPELTITTPEDNASVASQVVVEGITEPEAIVSVNAQPVSLQPDGSFKTEILLPREGITSITVEATDRRGKTSLIQRTVFVKF
jgi:cytoskeletal protein RodZ